MLTNVIPISNTTTLFQVELEMAGKTVDQASTLAQPLIATLNGIGIAITAPVPTTQPYGTPQVGTGDNVGNIRLASRLFPRSNWDDAQLFNQTMAAIRNVVEGGYTFHGLNMAPTEAAGWQPLGVRRQPSVADRRYAR